MTTIREKKALERYLNSLVCARCNGKGRSAKGHVCSVCNGTGNSEKFMKRNPGVRVVPSTVNPSERMSPEEYADILMGAK